jgi:TRAP-type C4-dicarboxylate transport system permease small subunit
LLLVQGIRILDVAAVQTSPAIGINMWYAYLAIPVGAALMLLESVLKSGQAVRALWRPA